MVGLLRSPLFGFSDVDLYQLTQAWTESGRSDSIWTFLQDKDDPQIRRAIEVITPFMREASRLLYKACSASILNETEIVYIARIPSQHQILSVNLNVGSRLPAYCTSMGRVLLGNMTGKELDTYFKHADLISHTPHTVTDIKKLHKLIKQTRIDGYSIVNQELEENLCSVAVPICNKQRKVLCSINVGMPVSQLKIEEITTEILPVLQEAASRAEAILAHH